MHTRVIEAMGVLLALVESVCGLVLRVLDISLVTGFVDASVANAGVSRHVDRFL